MLWQGQVRNTGELSFLWSLVTGVGPRFDYVVVQLVKELRSTAAGDIYVTVQCWAAVSHGEEAAKRCSSVCQACSKVMVNKTNEQQ